MSQCLLLGYTLPVVAAVLLHTATGELLAPLLVVWLGGPILILILAALRLKIEAEPSIARREL